MIARRPIPEVAPGGRLTLPEYGQETLPTGLRLIAAERRTTLFEVRLRVPFIGAPGAQAVILAETVLAGTTSRGQGDPHRDLHEIGGHLQASVDADNLIVRGSALAEHAERLLEILADALACPAFPAGPVDVARGRIARAMRVSSNQPGLIVHDELNRRLYPGHPYGAAMPKAAQVLAVDRADLVHLHRQLVCPSGATLVMVGGVPPDTALRSARGIMARWDRKSDGLAVPPAPSFVAGALGLVHRPGAVQSSVRLAMAGVGLLDPRFAALQLANLVLGGYFSARLVDNLRERNGFSYTPGSTLVHRRLVTTVVVSFDVSTAVTAAALEETYRELETLATKRIDGWELERARRYVLGRQRLAMTSTTAIADLLAELAGHGADLDWFAEHGDQLNDAGPAEVHQVAEYFLAPSRTAGVVLGDAEQVHNGRIAFATSGDERMRRVLKSVD